MRGDAVWCADEHMGGVFVTRDRARVVESLTRLGFPEVNELGTMRSVAHMFGTSKRRCGIYALVLPRDRVYIGQAVDVVRRFGQHRLSRERIDAFAFVPVPRTHLYERERALIAAAERDGLEMANVMHVSTFSGDSDLDTVVPPDLQTQWLAEPYAVNARERRDVALLDLPRALSERFSHRAAALERHPAGRTANHLLATFLSSCVPLPRSTEYSFWAVSCLPSTGSRAFPRLVCVNAGVMELFVIGGHRSLDHSRSVWGFVNVAADVLHEGSGSDRRFKSRHRGIEVEHSTYRDAGQHQRRLAFDSEGAAADALFDPRVQRAAGTLALRVMRKRATIYSKYHCKQLADTAFAVMP